MEGVKGTERNLADGGKDTVHKDEGNGVREHLVVCRGKEVGIREYGIAFLIETGGAFDFRRFSTALYFGAQERLHRPLLVSCRLQQVYPEKTFLIDGSEIAF